eukprot:15462002-Alexandrium_andersonii.AAC.1
MAAWLFGRTAMLAIGFRTASCRLAPLLRRCCHGLRHPEQKLERAATDHGNLGDCKATQAC